MIGPVAEREYARLLGYPWGTALEGAVRERAEQAADWYARYCRPRVYCAKLEGQSWIQTPARVVAITAGIEVDEEVERLWSADRVDEAYFLDRYAAGVVEQLASELGDYRSPGTAGVPFEEQWTLFSHIASLKPEIEILSSGMLRPKNSLLTMVLEEGAHDPNPCMRCDLPGCRFRRRSV